MRSHAITAHPGTRVVAFKKVRVVIYFVITIKIFNHSKLVLIIYCLLKIKNVLFRMVHVGFIVLQTLCDVFLIRHVFNSRPFSISKSTSCSCQWLKVFLKLWTFRNEFFSDFGNNLFCVYYCSVNAKCVAVNGKAIQPCVRNKRYWLYEVNAKKSESVRS